MSWAEFDRFFEERGYKDGQEPEAFAEWLANKTGHAVVAGSRGRAPTIIAAPEGTDEGAGRG